MEHSNVQYDRPVLILAVTPLFLIGIDANMSVDGVFHVETWPIDPVDISV